MKKYFSLLLLTLAGFSFMACEDVPAPYGINLEAAANGSLAAGQVFNEPLSLGLGNFQVKTPSGLYAWAYEGHGCIQITSYDSGSNNEADSYLVSPAATLEDKDYHFSFEYILRYAQETTMKKNHTVVISDNYDGDPATATWTVLDFDIVQGSDWDNWYKADINIPEAYRGKKVTIAFHYIGETSKAATWEVRKAILAEGKAAASADDVVGDVTFFSESFSKGLGDFTQNVVLPAGSSSLWTFDSGYSCAKVTGFINQTSTATEAWLISPVIDLRKATGAYLSFEHACNKFTAAMSSQATIWAKTTSATEWTQLTPENYPTSWTFVKSGNINLEAFIGKKMQFAFKYVSSTSSAGTWEVKKAQVTGFGEAGTNGLGWEDFTNGGFDQWDAAGVKPEGWQEDNAIGDADIARSEDAHTAPYACLVKGTTAISRSLAYEAMAFPAGTYTVSFYAKAANATESATLRVGCNVKGEDGDRMERDAESKLVNHVVGATWEQISYTFTLEASADVTAYSVALIFRNMKSAGKDFLIDDVTISKAE